MNLTILEAQRMVDQFNQKTGAPINLVAPDLTYGTDYSDHVEASAAAAYFRLALLRVQLHTEEGGGEFAEAAFRGDKVAMADALADLLYVTLGSASVFGINLEEVFREVHRSNMTKRFGDDMRCRDKGEKFSPVDLSFVTKHRLPFRD